MAPTFNPDHHGLINGRVLRQPPTGPFGFPNEKIDSEVPGQMKLFDEPEVFEPREKAINGHMFFVRPDKAQRKAQGNYPDEWFIDKQNNTLFDSRMPNDLIKAVSGDTSVGAKLIDANGGPKYSGIYQPHTGDIVVRNSYKDKVLLHELGHRADWRSMDAEGYRKGESGEDTSARWRRPVAGGSSSLFTNNETPDADPRSEGIADGFYDRYGDRQSENETLSDLAQDYEYLGDRHSSYSTNYQNWSPLGRAVYGSARAHFQQTGENPPAKNVNEYMFQMMATSPHARNALRDHRSLVPAKDAGSFTVPEHPSQQEYSPELLNAASDAAERYIGSRKVGTQLSLFGDSDTDVHDIPNEISGGLSVPQFRNMMNELKMSQLVRGR